MPAPAEPERFEHLLERPWSWLVLLLLLAASIVVWILSGAEPLIALG